VLLQEAVNHMQLARTASSSHHGGCDPQHLSNISWSLAVLDLQQHIEQLKLLVQACSRQQEQGGFHGKDLQQFYQVHLWLLDCQVAGHQQGLSDSLTAEQLRRSEVAWRDQLAESAAHPTSRFQLNVFEILRQLPIDWQQPPQLEQLCQPDGVHSIDIIATRADGVRLAVEVDGPTHFRRPPDNGLMGPTLFRNRALAARGYKVVSVPYFIWWAFTTNEQKQRWLLNEVAQHHEDH
jgi:hypothetical protein